MKKAIIYSTLVLAAATLFSCRKETSIENGKGLAANFVAQIDGTAWAASDSAQSASMLQGMINLTGISSDDQQLSITLDDTVIGVYILDQQSSSVAVYADLASSAPYAYSTNQGSDTSQAGGTVTVTSIDRVNKTISGVFSFKVYRDIDQKQKTLTSGVFYNLPFAVSLPPSSQKDTLTANIDNASWTGQSISSTVISGQLAISGSALDGSEAITLLMPSNSTAGSYPLIFSGSAYYMGIYNPTPSQSLVSTSGNLTILEINTATSRIRGNFQFLGTDVLGSGATSQISNGYFSVYYGQ
jgi:Family of unknown function (DUF6252)